MKRALCLFLVLACAACAPAVPDIAPGTVPMTSGARESRPGAETPGRVGEAAVVSPPPGERLGILRIPVPQGVEARPAEAPALNQKGVIFYRDERPLASVRFAPLGGASPKTYAQRAAKPYPGAVEDVRDGVYYIGPAESHSPNVPGMIFLVPHNKSVLVLEFYDNGPEAGDIVKSARAETPQLQELVDRVMLSPEERTARKEYGHTGQGVTPGLE